MRYSGIGKLSRAGLTCLFQFMLFSPQFQEILAPSWKSLPPPPTALALGVPICKQQRLLFKQNVHEPGTVLMLTVTLVGAFSLISFFQRRPEWKEIKKLAQLLWAGLDFNSYLLWVPSNPLSRTRLISSKFLIALTVLLTICCSCSLSPAAAPRSHFYSSLSHLELRLKFLSAIIGPAAGDFLFAPYRVLVRYVRVCAETDTQCGFANEEIYVAFSQLLRKCWPCVRAFPWRWEHPAPGSPWWFWVNSGHISISESKPQFPQRGAPLGTALFGVAVPKHDRTDDSSKAVLWFCSMHA